MILKRLPLSLAYAIAAISVLGMTIALQMAEIQQIGFVGFVLGAWLISSLLLGFSVRNSLLFSALFFIKPLHTSFLIMLVILLFSLLLEYLQTGRKALVIPYPTTLAILLATCVYGLIQARNPGDAFLYFLTTVIVPAILLILIANSRLKKADFILWMRLIVFVGVFLGVIGMAMALLNPAERYGSLWITAMTINGFYTLSFFFAIALGVRAGDGNIKYLWYACALLIFLGMMYTYTRIALVAVFLGFFLLMLRMKRLRYIGMGVLLVLPLIIPSSMVSRIQLGLTFDISIFIRLLAWYTAGQQIIQHPWFGIGIGTWKEWYVGAVPLDMLYAEHPHNLILKLWLEIGIFGLLSYLYLVWAVLRKYYQRLVKPSGDNFHRIILIGVIALLFACLTDIFIQQYEISLVFWTTLGFIYILSRQSQPAEFK